MRITTYIIQIMIIIMMMTQVLVSCTAAPPTSTLASSDATQDGKDDDKNDDDKDDDKNDGEVCRNINSCEDICDDMFEDDNSAALACGRLNEEEADRISDVSNVFLTEKAIRMRDLKGIKAGDLKKYLDIGVSQLLHIFKGEANKNRDDAWDPNLLVDNSQAVLEWILTNDNIAQEFLDHDTKNELARQLFSNLGGETDGSKGFVVGISQDPSLNSSLIFDSTEDKERIFFTNTNNDKEEIDLRDIDRDDKEKINFFIGFTQVKIKGTVKQVFMIEALDEEETTAIKWAHKAAISYCREGADADEDDIKVKYCLQAIYCTLRSQRTNQDSWTSFDFSDDASDNASDISLIYAAITNSSETVKTLRMGLASNDANTRAANNLIVTQIVENNRNYGNPVDVTGDDNDEGDEDLFSLITEFVGFVRSLLPVLKADATAPAGELTPKQIITDFLFLTADAHAPDNDNDRVFDDLDKNDNDDIFGDTSKDACQDFDENVVEDDWKSKS